MLFHKHTWMHFMNNDVEYRMCLTCPKFEVTRMVLDQDGDSVERWVKSERKAFVLSQKLSEVTPNA